ncbi:carbohydrate kinase family protein [Nocardioides mangrovicus]|uniref:Carbohydrate kinase family protein n=1 Tax=Nocardioides mangrovicus TaxID=2478913 RepID=A0A3L8P6W4_9ACTN|nr:PfkB family carbohydrate kinase [Nocardioides mangrovicus]RLV50473.1 carbohydrate kinase family protein [Nocardioides mangrovicus]
MTDDADFDVFLSGMVFLDIIFTGLATPPTPGKEVWATGMGSCPGGIANLATAASRLGLRTSLAAAFSDDAYGEFCWSTLADQEGIDLIRSRRFEHWHSPVTVSIATGGDRSMVTHGHAAPMSGAELIGRPPRSRAVVTDLETDPERAGTTPEWVRLARDDGALVFADVGWDDTGVWSEATLGELADCDAFLPNATEAMAYTRTDTARDALYALADLVPLAVVTAGTNGAMAIDSTTGEEAQVPALRVQAIDATGAGDVFATGLVLGTLEGWPLEQRLAFASLCSALAVEQFGGSLAAPGLGDVLDWWAATKAATDTGSYTASLRRRYGFLDDLHPDAPVRHRRRAAATIARLSDL